MELIEALKNGISSSVVTTLGRKLGITEEQTRTGMDYAIPSVLAGLLNKAAGSGTFGSLSSIFTGNTIAVTTDPVLELVDEHSLHERGRSMIGDLFGADTESIITLLQEKSGLSNEKSTDLLTSSVPIIASYTGQLISRNGWSMPDFIGYLFENKSSIESALPIEVASTLGIGKLNLPHINAPTIETREEIVSQATPEVSPIERAVPPTPSSPEPSSSKNVLQWIIIIALLILAAWWFMGQKGCSNDEMVNESDTTVMN